MGEAQDETLKSLFLAGTWGADSFGTLDYHALRDGIGNEVKKIMDRFLNDYLAVNPEHAPIQSNTPSTQNKGWMKKSK